MTTLVLRPLDTLFFRDGRPYNQDDPGQAEAASVFPPHPPTVVGAVRAALARAMGWPGRTWDKTKLGDGVDWRKGDGALGPLRFTGPYVLRNDEPLFPAPLSLVRAKNRNGGDILEVLSPGDLLACDLGETRLPAAPKNAEGWKTLEGKWLTLAGMEQALAGKAPSQIVDADAIYGAEPRVGVQRDASTRTTKRFEAEGGEPARGALYAAAHVRPAKDVALAVEVDGLPDLSAAGALAPLGGEGRSVWIEQRDQKIKLPKAPELKPGKDGVLRYTVTLITPADLGEPGEDWPRPGDRLFGSAGEPLPGTIVSACLGRAIAIGGWDTGARGPLPLRPLVRAGGVFFLEAKGDEAQAVASWRVGAVGRAAGWGFGRMLIGRWAREGEAT
jgi:CRISPR-associated protein Cmr3